ncbi:pyridoxal phosphate-dependent aminotransferase [Candidatus Bathyarchaeota archaeon]|jgi:aspartate aminotransferase|nr:pyridoxal phosphate-dependent aminotransferase [Candidatus Bathyarchaeota archaeon]
MLYEINEKALKLENEGKKIIKLNIGDPDLETPPEIVEAAYDAMKRGKTKYSSAYGEKSLREKLASIHKVYTDNVIMTPGSKFGIFSIMYLLLKGGGNVVIPTPYWTAYELIAKTLGAETKLVKTELESNWKINLATLESAIDKNTRMIILNNPKNPTSNVIDQKVLDGIVRIADEKGLPILSDEVYADISFVKTKSILEYGGDHILVTGFSKTFTMTGWRLGYAIANTGLVEKLAKLNQITISNVPVFIQEAALKALELGNEIKEKIRQEYRERARLACDVLSKSKLEFSEPSAPFYIFPRRRGLDSEKFALNLLDEGVAVAPGTAFGDYREHFRISLTAPRDDLNIALNKICEAVE